MQDGTIDPRKATLTLTLKPRGQRPRKQVIENQIRSLMLQIPGARIKVGLGGSGERYMVMLIGEDPVALASSAQAFEKELRTLKGIGNISSSAALVRPEIALIPHLDKAAELGGEIGPQIVETLPPALQDLVATSIVTAIHPIFWVTAVLALIGLGFSLLLREVPLHNRVVSKGE